MEANTKIDTIFRSGMSCIADFIGAREAGVPIGVVVGELTTSIMLMGIPNYLCNGGKVFVDSGAFTAFRSGEPMDWKAIMSRYQSLAETAELDDAPGNLYLVSPDVVGNQQATLELLREWSEQLRTIIQYGVNLIVPLQSGSIAGQTMLEEVSEILGSDRWVAGIPSNRAAMSVEECATLKHHTFHILGRVQMDAEQCQRISGLRRLNPAAIISADANWLRSRIKQVSIRSNAIRTARVRGNIKDAFDSPRTEAITALLLEDDWGTPFMATTRAAAQMQATLF